MAPKKELVVSESTPMPKGYAFLHKGNRYKTLHCRRLTHEAGRKVYVVEKGKEKVGIRIPRDIYHTVQNLARDTADTRLAATERRDAAVIREAEAEMKKLYPKIPPVERERCLKRAFRKHSRRIGRNGRMDMAKKVELAVIAHIRHNHTSYDALLNGGVDRKEARHKVAKEITKVRCEWGASQGKP